jgi:SpoVK/Ycf46/Vps4 family AAA+-type ATPase
VLADKIEPGYTWGDIVLEDDATTQLHQLADQVRQRALVYDGWGFAPHHSRGRGVSAMFAGPSGTGKTMAAEILAGELELDLLRVNLAGVVSKYVGETSKNLQRIFDAAQRSGAILLFDEADALFGTRTEVRDSHDRYAVLEINHLLQLMQDYRGLAILATNRRAAVDSAFLRRLRFVIEFGFPGPAARALIWQRSFPAEADCDDLDVGRLARLEIPGGNIRSIALNAAFLAAAGGHPISMADVVASARLEYAKIGRPLNADDLGTWAVTA